MKALAPGTAEAALRVIARMVLVAVALVFSFQAVPAHAAFPGDNGKLALAKQRSDGASFLSVWTINPDGSGLNELIMSGFPPAVWSPSGTRIAYSGASLGVANADGSNADWWYDSGLNITGIAWSPDETQIAFIEDPAFSEGYPSHLFVMPAQSGAAVTSIAVAKYGPTGLSWSPDGSRLAFGGEQGDAPGIYTIKPDGTGKALVPGTGALAWQNSLDWSPDASRLAFPGEQGGVKGIFTIRPDGTWV